MNILEQNSAKDPEEFYASLHEKLSETHDFPEDYVYKFIIPSSEQKLTEIYRVFDGIKTTFSNKESKNGKYTSITVNAFVLDANQVITIYKEVGKIEGVIML